MLLQNIDPYYLKGQKFNLYQKNSFKKIIFNTEITFCWDY